MRRRLVVIPRAGAKKSLIEAMARLGAVEAIKEVPKAKKVPLALKPAPEPVEILNLVTGKIVKSIEELENKSGDLVKSQEKEDLKVSACTFRTTGCCGLREFKDMSACDNAAEVLAIMVANLGGIPNYPYVGAAGNVMGTPGYNQPHVLFTGLTKIGERKQNHVSKFNKEKDLVETVLSTTFHVDFIDYLKKHDLGPVWEGPARENSCYGNEVGVFIWNPDYEKLKKWAASHLKAEVVQPKGQYGTSPSPNLGYYVPSDYKATKVVVVDAD